jgi:predicted glycoside hydrolase/deacetylase ChbG (UPF0249 family)
VGQAPTLREEELVNPNPVLRKLGFDDGDRLAIIHADDIGMCQATVPAFADLVAFGLVSSGAVMVPCPWFPYAAEVCRAHPEADVGIHLTLTSEWDSYRWGPLSTRDPDSGLLDEEGYFYRRSEEVQEHADPEAVAVELAAQVDRALAAGLDVTHLDTHMGAVAHLKFVPAYVQLAQQHRLPFLMARLDEAGWRDLGLDDDTASLAVQFAQLLEAQGQPLLDNLIGLSLDEPENRLGQAKEAFAALPAGLTHFIIHPACDTPELRAATPTTWACRVADYQTFGSEELRAYLRDEGIHVIGYRDLRALLH